MSEPRACVLVVDDDVAFGKLVADLLGEKGYEAPFASEPGDAARQASARQPAAAIVDLVLPGKSGIELADEILACSPNTQIIILTGHASLDSAIEGIQHGIFEYMQKESLDLARLERAVQQAVGRSELLERNCWLVDRLEDSNRLLKVLHEISTSLAGLDHLDALLDRLVVSAKSLCGAGVGRVLLLKPDGEGGFLVETCVGDAGEVMRGARLPAGEGIAVLAVEKEEAILVGDPLRHPRFSNRCDDVPAGLRFMICAPLLHGTVQGVLTVAGPAAGSWGGEQSELLASLARQAAIAIDNAFRHDRAINFFTHTSDMLLSILDRVDCFAPGHSRATAALADMLSRRLGMPEEERRNVHFGALLHDIGKVHLSPELLKAVSPTDAWRQEMQQHPVLGCEMLRPITLWEGILPVVRFHHERWDGKGYPAGLEGEAIPLGARVVAVVEVFDAMTRATFYRPGRSPEDALRELEEVAGSQLDPRLVRLFVKEYRSHGEQAGV